MSVGQDGERGARASSALRLDSQLFELYEAALAKAERERRWSVFEDVPWERAKSSAATHLAECAETFFVIESFLPDYLVRGLAALRGSSGPSWYCTSWAYEKAKHQLALRKWLICSQARSGEQLLALESRVLSHTFASPWSSARQMLFYGCVQEMSAFVTYAKHREVARRAGDECLRTIYDFIARDEIAHARFLEAAMGIFLTHDRVETLRDMAHVLDNFITPGKLVLPDYDQRMERVRAAGLDRDVFIQRVYVPILKHLGVSRRELGQARRPPEDAHQRRSELCKSSLEGPRLSA